MSRRDPFAERIEHSAAGFRTSARLIWQGRAHPRPNQLAERYLRDAMRMYAGNLRTYRTLAGRQP